MDEYLSTWPLKHPLRFQSRHLITKGLKYLQTKSKPMYLHRCTVCIAHNLWYYVPVPGFPVIESWSRLRSQAVTVKEITGIAPWQWGQVCDSSILSATKGTGLPGNRSRSKRLINHSRHRCRLWRRLAIAASDWLLSNGWADGDHRGNPTNKRIYEKPTLMPLQ